MSSAISMVKEDLANDLEGTVQRGTVSATDAWGTTTNYEIEWLPEVVEGVMLGHENIGEVPIVWLTVPPVEAVKSTGTGVVYLRTPAVRVTGEYEWVVEGVRVDTEDELQPGTFRVVREWDSWVEVDPDSSYRVQTIILDPSGQEQVVDIEWISGSHWVATRGTPLSAEDTGSAPGTPYRIELLPAGDDDTVIEAYQTTSS